MTHIPPLTGGCHCGAIKYTIALTPKFPHPHRKLPYEPPVSTAPNGLDYPVACVHCHCGNCRKTSGALYLTLLTVPTTQLTYTTSKTPKRYKSSSIATRGFCDECGTSIYWQGNEDPEYIDITVGSLNEPDRVAPVCNVWGKSAVKAAGCGNDGLKVFVEAESE